MPSKSPSKSPSNSPSKTSRAETKSALPASFYRPNPAPGAQPSFAQAASGRPLAVSSIDFIRQNPLDVFSRIAVAENYDRERLSARELHLSMPGEFTDHHVSLSWSASDERLSLFLLFDGKIPGGRSAEICLLLSLLNERLAAGHFDYWSKEENLVYRDSISLSGQARISTDQAMAMLSSARSAAETGYPACQYVLWAGQTPEDAVNSALLARAKRDQSFRSSL